MYISYPRIDSSSQIMRSLYRSKIFNLRQLFLTTSNNLGIIIELKMTELLLQVKSQEEFQINDRKQLEELSKRCQQFQLFLSRHQRIKVASFFRKLNRYSTLYSHQTSLDSAGILGFFKKIFCVYKLCKYIQLKFQSFQSFKYQLMKHQNVLGTKMKSYNFMKVLGQGAWAIVYEAFDQATHTNVAVKAIPKILMKQTPKLQELVRTQIRVLRECKNQNVIRFVESFATEKTQFIAMEFCDGGDLQNYLNKKKRLTEDEATTFLKQILNGFRGLHQVNAMHRDFKVANVLLHQGICKIADLGFAKQMEKKKMTGTILGTSLTMAPELLRQQKYGMQADIWSVGVVYYQLLYGKYPFMGLSDLDILKKIENTKPDFSGVNLSTNALNFIQRCLTDNPVNRISWREIYDHPLIKSQQKMVYGLVSRINFKENQEFYNKGIKIDDDYIYAQRKEMKKKQSKEQIIIQPTQKVDMNKFIKENEEKKKISQAIQRYEKAYLNRRNNIMFVFKFVTPYVYSLYNINANHGITLFIISKKAYHDMKNFVQFVKNKADFLKLGQYFNQFVKSTKYSTILEVVSSDLDIIVAQLWSYKEDIEYCSNQIKKEYDIEAIYSQNWGKLVKDTIDSYEFQLAQGLDKVKGDQKKDLIKVVEALIYYKNNADADVEDFDRKIETLNYNQAEASLKSKFDALFK